MGSFYGERVLRGKSHTALTVHGVTKSVRETHPVALGLIQAKVHTALAVLFVFTTTTCFLPLPCIKCRGSSFYGYSSSTLLHNIPASLCQKILRAARHCVRRNTTRKDAQKSTKVMENGVTTLHMFCLFEIPSQFTQRFSQYYPSCSQSVSLFVIVRKHLRFQYYGRQPLTRLNVKPKKVPLLPQVKAR